MKIVSRAWSPQKLNHHNHDYFYYSLLRMASFQRSRAVGLGILTEKTNSRRSDSNVVFYSGPKTFITKPPTFQMNQTPQKSFSKRISYCFLKSCFLCNKTLSPDEDVYMYRGDQGFCSEECRSREIYLDEMREIEISTRKKLASIRRCHWDSILLNQERRHDQGRSCDCEA